MIRSKSLRIICNELIEAKNVSKSSRFFNIFNVYSEITRKKNHTKIVPENSHEETSQKGTKLMMTPPCD